MFATAKLKAAMERLMYFLSKTEEDSPSMSPDERSYTLAINACRTVWGCSHCDGITRRIYIMIYIFHLVVWEHLGQAISNRGLDH